MVHEKKRVIAASGKLEIMIEMVVVRKQVTRRKTRQNSARHQSIVIREFKRTSIYSLTYCKAINIKIFLDTNRSFR